MNDLDRCRESIPLKGFALSFNMSPAVKELKELSDKIAAGDLPKLLDWIVESPSCPAEIVWLFDLTFQLVDKGSRFPPTSFMSPAKADALFGKVEALKPVVPPSVYAQAEQLAREVSSAGCSGCAKRSRSRTLVQILSTVSPSDASLPVMTDLFGEAFAFRWMAGYFKMPETAKGYHFGPQSRPLGSPPPPPGPPSGRPTGSPPKAQPAAVQRAMVSQNKKPEASPPPIRMIKAPRSSCLDCARKHLSQAAVLDGSGEVVKKWIAVGHMAEASEELLADFPDFAHLVRGARLIYMKDFKDKPDFEMLIQQITALI